QLAPNDLRSALIPERDLPRYFGVLVDAIDDLVRAKDEALSRKAIDGELAVMRAVVPRHHPRREVVLLPWRERSHKHELGFALAWEAHHHVAQEGFTGGAPFGASGRPVARHTGNLPLIFAVVERLRIAHVVRRIQHGLHAKEIFRIS